MRLISGCIASVIVLGLFARVVEPEPAKPRVAAEAAPVATPPAAEPPPARTQEILWLARMAYSETKLAHEQALVAWVARNRVETGYKGDTYQEVVLSPHQFSGLNPQDPHYEHNVSRTWDSEDRGWDTAVEAARSVLQAPASLRPFSITTRHFYSPCAVSAPGWAVGQKATHLVRRRGARSSSLREIRFAFYDGIR